MAKLGRILLFLVAGVVGLVIIAAVALFVFFDANDFRDNIAAEVRDATGRELVIEGDLSVSIFPWLAVEIGRTTLGNAEGFGDEPFLTFESASLRVRVLPLIFGQEIAVGTASLNGFEANLAVASNGVTNWDDLSEAAANAPATTDSSDSAGDGGDVVLDIANVALNDARLNYSDAQSGSRYSITGLNVSSGRIAIGEAFDVSAMFDFAATPGEMGGQLSMAANITLGEGMQRIAVDGLNVSGELRGIVSEPTAFNLDSRAIVLDAGNQRMTLGEIDLAVLGMTMSADVEPFSYAGPLELTSALRVAEFSLKELMTTLDIEPPATADPNAMGKVSFEATAVMGEDALHMSAMSLVLDDTTMSGDLSVPLTEAGSLVFDLRADSITLDNYMAPASEEVVETAEGSSDVEIPADLVRALKANGTIRLDEAFLGPVTFTNMALGVNAAGGRLRLNPITAEFFDGVYNGDVLVDASGDIPALSVNERIGDVNLSSMAQAMYGVDNISGTMEGSFELGGSGATLSAVSADLDGEMRFAIADGVWEGTDVWHQLRSARALFKREAPPEARMPPRTEFTSISATGQVNNGIFTNNDLLVEMPFLRVTGTGNINLGKRVVDYSVQARVLEKPEFMSGASDAELADFTEALIPIRITGPLASPSFRPDIEGMFREEVERAIEDKTEELKRDLLDSLLGGDEETEEQAGEGTDTEEEKDVEDELKDALKDLFPH